ncbi:LAQU0S01e08592g1_1 [Lachancea quebecensis]|uniref:LAQU0S01e08592g1_1 n=1 Tax=Lachancea quebecensis TaxID=1654605 RepID=A0A0N7MKV4_9SACH|nr:LAQU0S01e08592g1_1 [Lachancea quebecensis]
MSSVKDVFQQLVRRVDSQIDSSSLRQDSKEFQERLTQIIGEFLELKSTVFSKLALFSDNETLEDLSTASMPLLTIDFYLGKLVSKKQAAQLQDTRDRNVLKLKFLRKAVQLYMQFLVSLRNYELLDKATELKMDRLEDADEPNLESLYAQPSSSKDLSGAQLKRQQKIEAYQQSKQVEAQIKALELKYRSDTNNDEDLRELQKYQLKQTAYKALNEIEQNLYEMELLSNFITSPPPSSRIEDVTQEDGDIDRTAYTDKLESLNQPLVSKTGKVLRNFTLVNKKTQIKDKVFGYGQYAPTMSVEEFLEKELQSGRVLQGGEQAEPQPNEDDEEWQDRETYKAREWDAFKEANPRGSGNTLNRG